ncbi:hypothetical protein [Ferruginibacter sp.]
MSETNPETNKAELKNREAAVFHEIDEAGKIEIDGKDYGYRQADGAHEESKADERKFYKKSKNPGNLIPILIKQ